MRGISLQTNVDIYLPQLSPIFFWIFNTKLYNKIEISEISINFLHRFILDVNNMISFNIGLIGPVKISFLGQNNSLTSSRIFWNQTGGEQKFLAEKNAINTKLIISHDVYYGVSNGIICFRSHSNRANLFNVTVFDGADPFFYITNTEEDVGKINLIVAELFTCAKVFGDVSSFILTFSGLDFTLIKGDVTYLKSDHGGAGAILSIGSFNSLKLIACKFNLSISFNIGALAVFAMASNNYFSIIDSNFINFQTGFIGNILIYNITLTITRCKFENFQAKRASFLIAYISNVTITEIEFTAGISEEEGFIVLENSELRLSSGAFKNLKSESSAFLASSNSKVFLNGVRIIESSFSYSLISFSSYCWGSIVNARFEDLMSGSLVIASDNTIVQMTECLFKNIRTEQIGLIILKSGSDLIMNTSVLINIQGTIIYASSDNKIEINGITASYLISKAKSFIFLSKYCVLTVDSGMFTNSENKAMGGIISASYSQINIRSTNVSFITSKSGGFVYCTDTNVTLTNVELSNIRAELEGTVFYCEACGLMMSNSIFYNNSQNSPLMGSNYAVIKIKNSLRSVSSIIIFENISFVGEGTNTSNIIYGEGCQLIIFRYTNISFAASENLISIFDSQIEISNNLFENNNSTYIWLLSNKIQNWNFSLKIFSLEIKNNHIKEYLFLIEYFQVEFTNISISNNSKSSSLIPYMYVFSSNLLMKNLSVMDNKGMCAFLYILEGNFLNVEDFVLVHNELEIVIANNIDANLKNISIRNNSINSLFSFQNSLVQFSDVQIFEGFVIDNDSTRKRILIYCLNASIVINNLIFLNFQSLELDNQYSFYSEKGQQLIINSSYFFNDFDISIYANEVGSIMINGSHFEMTKNQISATYGGVNIFNSNFIKIVNSNFINLGGNSTYSSLLLENQEAQFLTILVESSNFFRNKAKNGGALMVKGNFEIKVKKCIFNANQALYSSDITSYFSGIGGSVYTECLQVNSCRMFIDQSEIYDNVAELLGGGIYTGNYLIESTGNSYFNNNTAFLLKSNNDSIMTNPYYLNISFWVNNYGDKVEYDCNNQTDVFFVNNAQSMEFKFVLYDLLQLRCDYETNFLAFLSLNSNEEASLKGGSTIMEKGTIDFKKVIIEGGVNETYSVQIKINGRFIITKNITFHIRLCLVGEYFDSTLKICKRCPFGTYSLENPLLSNENLEQKGISICKSCPENAFCEASKIVPGKDFWINNSNTTNIVVGCPLSGTCLLRNGNFFSKNVSCLEGYEGPLCINCKSGYSKEGFFSECLKCSWEVKDYFILVGKLLFILAFVIKQTHSTIFADPTEDDDSSGIIIKIGRDHFNQIFLISSFSAIFQFDTTSLGIVEGANNIVSGSALNFDCFYEQKTIDIFYFKQIMIFLSPIYLFLFVNAFFLLLFLVKKIMKKNVYFRYFLKSTIASFIVVCETQYTTIVVSFLKIFDCVRLDSNYSTQYLKYATNIECYSDEHISFILKIGLPFLVIWILGLPIIFFIKLYQVKKNLERRKLSFKMLAKELKNENNKNEDDTNGKDMGKAVPGIFEKNPHISLALSFLFYDYNEEKYYWTSIIMLWKSVMGIIITFVSMENLFISMFFYYLCLMAIYRKGQPYKNDITQILVLLSFACNLTSVVLGDYYYKINKSNGYITIINFVIHIIFLLITLFLFFKEYNYESLFKKIIGVFEAKKDNKYAQKILIELKKIEFSYNFVKTIDGNQNSNTIRETPNDQKNSYDLFESKDNIIEQESATQSIKNLEISNLILERNLDPSFDLNVRSGNPSSPDRVLKFHEDESENERY